MRRFDKTARDYEALMVEELEADGCEISRQDGDLIASVPSTDPTGTNAAININLSHLAEFLERQLS